MPLSQVVPANAITQSTNCWSTKRPQRVDRSHRGSKSEDPITTAFYNWALPRCRASLTTIGMAVRRSPFSIPCSGVSPRLLLAIVCTGLVVSKTAWAQTYGVYRELYAGLDPNDNSYGAFTNAPTFPNS